MQASYPELPSPNGPGSPLQRNFFGGSFFTTPPEEVGDTSTENRRRKSWWGGGERDSSLPRKASGVEKKPEKEKQRSDKEKLRDEPAKQKKPNSKGQNPDGKEGAERLESSVQHKSEGIKEGTKMDVTHYPGSGEVGKDVAKAEVVGEVVIGDGSLPAGEDITGEVRTVDKQLNAKTTEKTGTGDDTVRSLREAKSLCSLNSNQSSKDSGKSFKKPWSLIITRRPTLERMPPQIPGKKLSEDVAGPRFETVKEPTGERCAGDYPSVYDNGFVSSIPPRIFISHDVACFLGGNELYPGKSLNPGGDSPFGA
jgi:hypothetical protein